MTLAKGLEKRLYGRPLEIWKRRRPRGGLPPGRLQGSAEETMDIVFSLSRAPSSML